MEWRRRLRPVSVFFTLYVKFMKSRPAWSAVLLLGVITEGVSGAFVIKVDVSQPERELKHFWRSTGFCPPLPHNRADSFDLSKDQIVNLAYISSVPRNGIEQVRIHWLLELIRVRFCTMLLKGPADRINASFVETWSAYSPVGSMSFISEKNSAGGLWS